MWQLVEMEKPSVINPFHYVNHIACKFRHLKLHESWKVTTCKLFFITITKQWIQAITIIIIDIQDACRHQGKVFIGMETAPFLRSLLQSIETQ